MATLGNTSIGNTDDTQSADTKEVYKVTPTENGIISKLTGYISGQGSGAGAQKFKTVIYADNAGVPDVLLGVSSEVTIADSVGYSWVDFTHIPGVSITAGVPIWIGYIGSSPQDGSQIKAFAGSGMRFNGDFYSDGPDANFAGSTVSGTKIGYSLYATYTASTPPPPSGLPFKGLATGYWLNQTDTQIQRTIAEAKAAGCQIMRWDVNPVIWSRTQAVAQFCINAAMPCYLVYNSQHDTTNINNNMALMVPWFRDRGFHTWEFMNEPNAYWGGWNGGSSPAALPSDYVAALRTFTTKVKSIDPNAYVLCGAISGASQSPPAQYAPDVWFQGLLDAGLALTDFDAVSVHPYNDVAIGSPGNLWYQTWGAVSIRSKMNAKGGAWLNKAIWASECGTAPPLASVGTMQTVINNIYTFFRRGDMGPLGAALIYSPEQSDGYTVLWPGGVANGAANTYAAIQVPANTSVGAYQTAIMADSPHGYWKLDEASGNLVDSSGNALTGTPHATITYAQAGIDGTGVALSSGGCITVADNNALDLGDTFSLEAWIKPGAGGDAGWESLIDKGTGAYTLAYDTVSRAFRVQQSNGTILCTSTVAVPNDSKIHHLVATKNGAIVKLYLDTVDVTGTVSNVVLSNTTLGLCIGGTTGGGGPRFGGIIDEVAVYGTALTQAQVTTHYQTGTQTTFARADLSSTFTIRARKNTDLTCNYNVAPQSPATHTVGTNLSPAWNLKSRVIAILSPHYNIAALGTALSYTTVVIPPPLPTDLDTVGQVLYDIIGPVIT